MDDVVKIPELREPLVPLSILALDLDAPAGGWHHYLAECNIAIVTDDIGQDCIARGDARKLFQEKRAAQQRAREIAEANEQAAIERDRQFRVALPKGKAWYDVPPGVHPATAMLQAAKDAQPRRTSSQVEWMFGLQDTGGVIHEPAIPEDAS